DAAAQSRVEQAVAQRIHAGAALGGSTSAVDKYAGSASSAASAGTVAKAVGVLGIGTAIVAGGWNWFAEQTTETPPQVEQAAANHAGAVALPTTTQPIPALPPRPQSARAAPDTARGAAAHPAAAPGSMDSGVPSNPTHPGTGASRTAHQRRAAPPSSAAALPRPSDDSRPARSSDVGREAESEPTSPTQRTERPAADESSTQQDRSTAPIPAAKAASSDRARREIPNRLEAETRR